MGIFKVYLSLHHNMTPITEITTNTIIIREVSSLVLMLEPNIYGLAVEATVPKADDIPTPIPLI